eukprot:GHVT01099194.1.p1 GENE.GHVT01099194.1~~GHVT01099194.1.p1  ORF type:complete len:264 (-),score=53.92 GHVT01099194.1:129-920(-)
MTTTALHDQQMDEVLAMHALFPPVHIIQRSSYLPDEWLEAFVAGGGCHDPRLQGEVQDVPPNLQPDPNEIWKAFPPSRPADKSLKQPVDNGGVVVVSEKASLLKGGHCALKSDQPSKAKRQPSWRVADEALRRDDIFSVPSALNPTCYSVHYKAQIAVGCSAIPAHQRRRMLRFSFCPSKRNYPIQLWHKTANDDGSKSFYDSQPKDEVDDNESGPWIMDVTFPSMYPRTPPRIILLFRDKAKRSLQSLSAALQRAAAPHLGQ